MIKTHLQSRDYRADEVVRIKNIKQQQLYMDNGVYPIDIYPTDDENSDRKITVMVFEKEKTKELYRLWCDYKLDYNHEPE